MIKEIGVFIGKLIAFSLLLLAVHYYIVSQFFTGELYFPIWTIYAFNTVLVFIIYAALRYYSKQGQKDMFKLFLGLTIVKMVLTIIFLLPLFFGKSNHAQMEVFNFFIPYFLFLTFEIINLNSFLQKT